MKWKWPENLAARERKERKVESRVRWGDVAAAAVDPVGRAVVPGANPEPARFPVPVSIPAFHTNWGNGMLVPRGSSALRETKTAGVTTQNYGNETHQHS